MPECVVGIGREDIDVPLGLPLELRMPFPPSFFAPQDKMKLEIKEFESDFEVLHQFLIGEQVLLLHQLEERYESLLARQSSNISQLEEQSAALSRLIAEAEDKSKQDGLQLLKVFWGLFFWDGKRGKSRSGRSREEGRGRARPLPDVFF